MPQVRLAELEGRISNHLFRNAVRDFGARYLAWSPLLRTEEAVAANRRKSSGGRKVLRWPLHRMPARRQMPTAASHPPFICRRPVFSKTRRMWVQTRIHTTSSTGSIGGDRSGGDRDRIGRGWTPRFCAHRLFGEARIRSGNRVIRALFCANRRIKRCVV
jgi:hypothetical protein